MELDPCNTVRRILFSLLIIYLPFVLIPLFLNPGIGIFVCKYVQLFIEIDPPLPFLNHKMISSLKIYISDYVTLHIAYLTGLDQSKEVNVETMIHLVNVSITFTFLVISFQFNKYYIKKNHRGNIIITEHEQYKHLINIKSLISTFALGVGLILVLILVQNYYKEKSPVPGLLVCAINTFISYTYSRNPKVVSYFKLYLRQHKEAPRLWLSIMLHSPVKVLPLQESSTLTLHKPVSLPVPQLVGPAHPTPSAHPAPLGPPAQLRCLRWDTPLVEPRHSSSTQLSFVRFPQYMKASQPELTIKTVSDLVAPPQHAPVHGVKHLNSTDLVAPPHGPVHGAKQINSTDLVSLPCSAPVHGTKYLNGTGLITVAHAPVHGAEHYTATGLVALPHAPDHGAKHLNGTCLVAPYQEPETPPSVLPPVNLFLI